MKESLRETLKKIQKEFPAPTLEQSYLLWKHFDYKLIAKKFPVLWNYVWKKRYILPQYRQADYYSQEIGDYQLLDMFFGYIQEMVNRDDYVIAHCMNAWVASFRYDRPTLFLERELGEPFMKMKLPMEYYASDIKWKWPAFRVYLPKGLLTITREGEKCAAMFIDICYLPKGKGMDMPLPIHQELTRRLGFGGKIPMTRNTFEGIEVTTFIELDCPEGGVGYAASAKLESNTFKVLMEQVGEEDLNSPVKTDDLDKDFLDRMLKLALNVLLYLSSEPMVYAPDATVLRKPAMIGDRLVSGLYPARFVGREQCRPGSKTHKATVTPTGITLPPHWVGGHHRWQRHGKGNRELKLIWINTYHTGHDPEPEDDLTRVKE